jgi:DeoR family fructose operon transcriptional repressor
MWKGRQQDNLMLPIQRQKKIKDYLAKNGFASVDELGKVFNVSGMTIRRDLDELQQQGLIQRTYGGAMDAEKAFFEMSFRAKVGQFAEEKERIGKASAELVEDGDTVFIDRKSVV